MMQSSIKVKLANICVKSFGSLTVHMSEGASNKSTLDMRSFGKKAFMVHYLVKSPNFHSLADVQFTNGFNVD